MVEQEILTLVEIYKDLEKMNSNKKKLVTNQLSKEREIASLESSSKTTVGFIKKKPKSLKIQELKDEVEHIKQMITIHNSLLMVGANLIRNTEINKIKNHKIKRFQESVKLFATRKLERAKCEQDFWSTLLECNDKLKTKTITKDSTKIEDDKLTENNDSKSEDKPVVDKKEEVKNETTSESK